MENRSLKKRLLAGSGCSMAPHQVFSQLPPPRLPQSPRRGQRQLCPGLPLLRHRLSSRLIYVPQNEYIVINDELLKGYIQRGEKANELIANYLCSTNFLFFHLQWVYVGA